jgi:Ni,Fe-hydrogenase III large subunit
MSHDAQPATETKVEDVLKLLASPNVRLVTVFGSHDPDRCVRVHYIAEVDNREYRILNCIAAGSILSATAITPAAAWHERELAEQFSLEIQDHPDLRPLFSHASDYRFLMVQGTGVCEVPVGPVHAGIIEPGHFRFSVVGDTVLHLELRHFYTHKGTEKLFEGAPVVSAPMLAESVSGDNCFSHAVAYCQAVEYALGVCVPPRAHAIRLIGLELERMIAHIADVGALCGDVAFSVPATYTARIKESLLRLSAQHFGTRFLRSIATPGGVKHDLGAADTGAFAAGIQAAARDFAELAKMILNTPSVQNRFETTGVLTGEAACDLGVVGPVARASGIQMDVRHDHPYGAYRDRELEVPHYHYGDVHARARIRIDEVRISAQLLADCLGGLPAGPLTASVPPLASGEGFSAVESPRGELGYWVRIAGGNITRCHIKSPSFQNWPALPLAMPGNIIADFPLINKSFNLSYSGCDR